VDDAEFYLNISLISQSFSRLFEPHKKMANRHSWETHCSTKKNNKDWEERCFFFPFPKLQNSNWGLHLFIYL